MACKEVFMEKYTCNVSSMKYKINTCSYETFFKKYFFVKQFAQKCCR